MYADYDTDSIFIQQNFRISEQSLFSFGFDFKGHAFDWQNLAHIVDPENGEAIDYLQMQAPFYRSRLFMRYKIYQNTSVTLAGGYRAARPGSFDQNDKVKIKGASWLTGSAGIGYGKGAMKMPGFYEGWQGGLHYTYLKQQQAFQFFYDDKLTMQSRPYYHKVYAVAGHGYSSGRAFLMFNRLILMGSDSAFSGKEIDFIEQFSIGGPEDRYHRLAGFAFSEFRVPGAMLVNHDFYYALGRSFYLNMVFDWAVFDREVTRSENSRYQAGTGIGFKWRITQNEKSADGYTLFFRTDYAITALRSQDADKVQVFTGLEAIF